MSLDGYIAGKNDDIEWLSIVDQPGEDYGYNDFVKSVDTVFIGRKTYDKVLSLGAEFIHKDRKCYVLSSTRTGSDENVTYYNGPVEELITGLRKEEGLDIYCDGGAEVIAELLQKELIDHCIISIIPIIIGEGIPLFKEGIPKSLWNLEKVLSFPSGLAQLWYSRK